MPDLSGTRWAKLWLNRPWELRGVPGTPMVELHGVRGFLVPGDVSFLFGLGLALPEGGNYLEIGSWQGLSAIIVANGLLANLNLRGTVHCVDTWSGSIEHQDLPEVREGRLFELFQHNVREAQVDGLVRAVRGASVAVARSWQGPALDTVFIDGDHSAEGCYQDIVAWRPLLAPGGRLLGHDAVPGGGVERALLRHCREAGCRVRRWPLPRTHYAWEVLGQGTAASRA